MIRGREKEQGSPEGRKGPVGQDPSTGTVQLG